MEKPVKNPFSNRSHSLQGPCRDIQPVTPSDIDDLSQVALALYIETGGMVTFVSEQAQTRSIAVADFSIVPVGVRRVLATGTTATGIHAFVVS